MRPFHWHVFSLVASLPLREKDFMGPTIWHHYKKEQKTALHTSRKLLYTPFALSLGAPPPLTRTQVGKKKKKKPARRTKTQLLELRFKGT